MTETSFGGLFLSIRNGMNIKQDKSGDGLPITRIETISAGRVDCSRVGYAGLGLDDAKDWLLKKGDILFSHINSVEHIGKCAVYEGTPAQLIHGMNLLCLRPDPQRLDPSYARWLIRSDGFRSRLSNFINKAVNQASVSITNLRGIRTKVPPVAEQRRIAAILDQAEALRAKRRQALAKLDTLAQSLFRDLFGDVRNGSDMMPLAQLMRADDGINYGVVQPGDDCPDGVPLIRVGDFASGMLDTSNVKRIDPAIESAYRRSRLKGDELIVSCVGSVGVVAKCDPSVRGFNVARAVARVPYDSSRVNPVYLLHYLRTDFIQEYFRNQLRTVAQPTLNIKQIDETPVRVPDRNLQDRFAGLIGAIDEWRRKVTTSHADIGELAGALQHRAFRGEL